jgi:hypothetical protein
MIGSDNDGSDNNGGLGSDDGFGLGSDAAVLG